MTVDSPRGEGESVWPIPEGASSPISCPISSTASARRTGGDPDLWRPRSRLSHRVRYLVGAHGGTVHAESAGRGKGSTFTVSLPLMKKSDSRPGGKKGPAGPEVAGNVMGIHILVVEDDPGTREALTEMLSLSGAEVRSAESAATAMALFEQSTPELLVCDIAMPDEDGYSLRRIRALGPEHGGDVPASAHGAGRTRRSSQSLRGRIPGARREARRH